MAQVLPLGPFAMRMMNRGPVRRRYQELMDLGLPETETARAFLPEVQALCAFNERIFPENALHWRKCAEMAAAHAEGPAALVDLVEGWGFSRDAQGVYQVPAWWDRLVVPMEFMDYYPERHSAEELRRMGVDPERYHYLAKKASDVIWMGYYIAKGALIFKGVSLLVKEITDAVHALVPRVQRPAEGPLPVYVIGISEDEVEPLRRPDRAVVAFNQGLSPVLQRMVREGKVHAIEAEGVGDENDRLLDARTREPLTLEGGQVYVCRRNVAMKGMPVVPQSGVVMTNETLHHNTYAEQSAMIRAMHRAALPVMGGGRAWIAGELFRAAEFPRLVIGLSTACGPTVWDGFVSFANGIACVEELIRRKDEWASQGVDLHFTYVPRGLVNAPTLVHRTLMCPTQALISGY